MRVRSALALAVVLGAASAQTTEERLRSSVTAIRYTPLAEAARVQGDVRLNVRSGVTTLISGHPLLTRLAAEHAKFIGSMQGETDLDVTYHFVLVDNTRVQAPIKVPRGNAFERAVLRALGIRTTKVVLEDQCQENAPPANDLKIIGAMIEVWVFGRARCIKTETATLAASR
jgi:hypothetical protein